MSAAMGPTVEELEDFDWRTSIVVSSSALEQIPEPIQLCRLALRTSDGRVRKLELTAEQLDCAIEALAGVEKKLQQQIALTVAAA